MKFLLVQTTASDHLYGVTNRAIAASLERLGQVAQILPAPANAPLHDIAQAIHADAPDFVFSLGSFLGGLIADSGVSIFDILGARFIGWQFDHPLYTQHNLAAPMAGRMSIYANASHAAFAARLGVSGPSAVLLAGGVAHPEPIKAFEDRTLPILVVATYNGPAKRPWETLPAGPERRLIETIADALMADPKASLTAACDLARRAFGLGPELERQIAEPLRAVLTYVRHKDRMEAVTALVDSGLPVRLVGDGWAEHFGARANLTTSGSVPFAEVHRLYGDAKVVVNVNAANGGCERAIQAMLAGAAVASDMTDSYAAMGLAEGDLRLFDRSRVESLATIVGDLIESDAARVAEQGYRRAMASQLWDHRLGALLDAVSG
jgi:hypothetical protein